MAVERYTLTSTSKTSGFFISLDICYRIKNFPILLFLTTFFFWRGWDSRQGFSAQLLLF